jgi:hypothetical protein
MDDKRNPFGLLMNELFSGGVSVDGQLSDDQLLALRVQRAALTISDLAEWVDDNDYTLKDEHIDPNDIDSFTDEAILTSSAALSSALQDYADAASGDDDDDENPFKVSDGDDPVF